MLRLAEISALVVDSNDTVTGHIISMTIGGKNGEPKQLHGKEVVVECKFDGDRIQIHKNGKDIHFFSRNFLDHLEYAHSMLDVIMQNILVDRWRH
ncbi:unnamed protein product [Camellia sinensis]